mgnify:CR=1 FL=1|tara:strand:+ start:111 stop:1169 length:1059 start_codon:yes stop_codon:yes gene_type:complete
MPKSFFEIKNSTFTASEKNKVLNFSLKIESPGEIICLLGPSGVGKTTILRSIAGLQEIENGEIILNDKLLSSKNYHEAPEKRNIALSFQDNCLFPHYSVLDNINFGSKRNNQSKNNISLKEIMKVLHIEDLVKKFPHEISAGEAQRVSLARSLMSNPELLLIDEPFSNIDQSLKGELQSNIKKILKKFQITTIMVTHDSYEAFYMGDKCAIILDQKLEQYNTPYNIYHYPKSIKVVKFLNRGVLVDAKIIDNNTLNHSELGEIKGNIINEVSEGKKVKLLLQPDDLKHDDKSDLKLEVIDRKFRGTEFIYIVKTKNNELIPISVDTHHGHYHEIKEKFGVKKPIYIDHLVCF